MTWNFRVVRETHGDGEDAEDMYTVREVHYDDDGSIRGWTANACSPAGETVMELFEDLQRMERSVLLHAPIIDVTSGKPVEVPMRGVEPEDRHRRPVRGGHARRI